MNKLYLFLSCLLTISFFSLNSYAQLTGIKNIPGDYANFTAAITDLNNVGVGLGGVTFNVAAGSVFNELPPVLNATGTSSNPIVFQKSGAGANPRITPNVAGTLTTTTLGNNADGILIINGGDYITFDGIDLDGNSAFTANITEKYEYGYYTKKVSGDDACKNVTIKNSTVTMYHGVTPFVTIGCGIFISNNSGVTSNITVNSTAGRTEGIELSGNTITGAYNGIQLRGYNAATPWDLYDHFNSVGENGGNIISNYGGSSTTCYGIYSIYQDLLKVNNNNISGGATQTSTQWGYFASTSNNASIDVINNNVSLTNNSTTSQVAGLGFSTGSTAGTDNTINVKRNTVTSFSRPAATTGVTYFIYATSNSPLNFYIDSNIIGNSSIPSTGITYGINAAANAVNTYIRGNTISGITRTSATSTNALYGINADNSTATTQTTISDNVIHSLTGMGSTGPVGGILLGAQTEINVYKNKIYNITSDNAGGIVYGITIGTGAVNTNIYNNLIGDLKTPNTNSTADAIRGINFTLTTANSTHNVSFNTVYLNAASSGTNFSTSGIYHTTSATATSAALNLRSNLIVNNSTANGSGLTIAYRRSSATLTNFGSVSDNNLYYAGNPGPANVIFYDGTTSDQLLQDYKTRVAPRDANSYTENVVAKFISTSGASADFLHLNAAIPTQVESNGLTVSGIIDDFDGTARYPNVGYPVNPSYPPDAPDIGADEFGGIPADLTPPVIVYTDLNNTASTGNRTLTANITDVSGVQTGTNGPRLYYKKSTDPSYIFDAAPSVAGNDYTFIINTASLGGVTLGTVIQYYVAAQDVLGNAGTNPGGGSGANPPGTTPPASPNTYTIVPSLSGTYSVGPGGDYANLTAVAALLNNTNSQVTGNVIFELNAAYDGTTGETVPINMPQFNNGGLTLSGAPFTVTIRPDAGVTGKVTSGDPGSNFSFAVINFEGGDYYVLDGRPDGIGTAKEWTIRNTRAAATIGCVVRFVNDATNNVLQYLNIESQATLTTTGAIFFHTSTGTEGNSSNSILNNYIRGRVDSPGLTISNGILSNGTASALNNNNTISNNHIYNFNNVGISLVATGNGANWTMSGNHFYNEHLGSATHTGISIVSANTTNAVISGNFIGGSAPNATGMWLDTANVLTTGISMTNGIAQITGNTIANMSGTNTGTTARTRGMHITSGNNGIEITGNSIFNLSSMSGVTGGYAAGNQAAVGLSIWLGSTFFTITITGNVINNISAENTTAFTSGTMAAGVFLTNFTGVCASNTIYNIKNKSTGTTPLAYPMACGVYSRFFSNGYLINNMISVGQTETTNTQFCGIFLYGAGSPNAQFYYYNTIAVGGTTSGEIPSFGFLRGDDTTTLTIQNPTLIDNIFHMTRTGGTATNYAIANKGTNAANGWVSNYNDLYNPTGAIGFWNNGGHTFPGWQIASGNDANSGSFLVNFVNPNAGDLHITGSSNGDLNLTGTPIVGVSVDIDGNPRNPDQPYMGADEGSIPLPVELASFTAVSDRNSVKLSWTTLTEINNSGFDIERKLIDAQGLNSFVKIANVQGSGNSNELKNYSYNDNGLQTGKYIYRLKQIDYNGNFEYHTLDNEIEVGVPKEFALSQNYPNPFNPVTKINYDLPVDSKVNLKVYDILGREVASLINNDLQKAGYYTVQLNAVNMASGTYFFRIVADGTAKDFVMTKKMVVIK